MSSLVDIKIVANANFAPVYAELAKLKTSMQSLTESAGTAGISKSLTAGLKAAESQMLKSIAATKAYSAETVALSSTTDLLTKKLVQGKFHLGEYMKMWGSQKKLIPELNQIAQAQSRIMQSLIVPSATKEGMAHVITSLRGMKNASLEASIYQKALNTALHQGTTSLINFGKNTQWAGRQLTAGFTMPLMIASGLMAKLFYDVDKNLTRLARVYGTGLAQPTEQAIRNIKDQIMSVSKELSRTLGVSAKEVTDIAAELSAAGLVGQDLVNATRQASRIVVLGETDKQEAVKATIALQTAYKLNTQDLTEAVNFFNAAQAATSTNMQDLVEAVPRVGPVVRGLGGTYKDMVSLLTAMKEGGVPAGEAANAIKNSLARIINPTEAAQKRLKSFGVDIRDIVAKNAGNLTGTIESLQSALDKLSSQQRQQAIAELFGKYQFARMVALMDNFGKVGTQSAKVIQMMGLSAQDLSKIADEQTKKIQQSASGKFKIAIESIKTDLIPIGQQFLKIATFIVSKVEKVVEFFNKLGPLKNIILGVLGGAAIVGPITMIVGLFANLVGQILKGINYMRMFREGFKAGPGGFLAGITSGLRNLTNWFIEADKAQLASQELANATISATEKQEASIASLTRVIAMYREEVSRLLATQAGLGTTGAIKMFPTTAPLVPTGLVGAGGAYGSPLVTPITTPMGGRSRLGIESQGSRVEMLHYTPYMQTALGTDVLGLGGGHQARNALGSAAIFPALMAAQGSSIQGLNQLMGPRQMPTLSPRMMTPENLAAVMSHYNLQQTTANVGAARQAFSLETISSHESGRLSTLMAMSGLSGGQLTQLKEIAKAPGAGAAEIQSYLKGALGAEYEKLSQSVAKEVVGLYEVAEKEVLSHPAFATAGIGQQVETISARYGELLREKYVTIFEKLDSDLLNSISVKISVPLEQAKDAIMEAARKNIYARIPNIVSSAESSAMGIIQVFEELIAKLRIAANQIAAGVSTAAAGRLGMTGRLAAMSEAGVISRGVAFADGGHVSGPGGPTDDKIPAMLSDGEYVIKASSVNKYGKDFLDSVNTQRFAKGGIARLNKGGQPWIDPNVAIGSESNPNTRMFNEGIGRGIGQGFPIMGSDGILRYLKPSGVASISEYITSRIYQMLGAPAVNFQLTRQNITSRSGIFRHDELAEKFLGQIGTVSRITSQRDLGHIVSKMVMDGKITREKAESLIALKLKDHIAHDLLTGASDLKYANLLGNIDLSGRISRLDLGLGHIPMTTNSALGTNFRYVSAPDSMTQIPSKLSTVSEWMQRYHIRPTGINLKNIYGGVQSGLTSIGDYSSRWGGFGRMGAKAASEVEQALMALHKGQLPKEMSSRISAAGEDTGILLQRRFELLRKVFGRANGGIARLAKGGDPFFRPNPIVDGVELTPFIEQNLMRELNGLRGSYVRKMISEPGGLKKWVAQLEKSFATLSPRQLIMRGYRDPYEMMTPRQAESLDKELFNQSRRTFDFQQNQARRENLISEGVIPRSYSKEDYSRWVAEFGTKKQVESWFNLMAKGPRTIKFKLPPIEPFANGGFVQGFNNGGPFKEWNPSEIYSFSSGENQFFNNISREGKFGSLRPRILDELKEMGIDPKSLSRISYGFTKDRNPALIEDQINLARAVDSLIQKKIITVATTSPSFMANALAVSKSPFLRSSQIQSFAEIDPTLSTIIKYGSKRREIPSSPKWLRARAESWKVYDVATATEQAEELAKIYGINPSITQKAMSMWSSAHGFKGMPLASGGAVFAAGGGMPTRAGLIQEWVSSGQQNIRQSKTLYKQFKKMMNSVKEGMVLYRGTVLNPGVSKELSSSQQKMIINAIRSGDLNSIIGKRINFNGPYSFSQNEFNAKTASGWNPAEFMKASLRRHRAGEQGLSSIEYGAKEKRLGKSGDMPIAPGRLGHEPVLFQFTAGRKTKGLQVLTGQEKHGLEETVLNNSAGKIIGFAKDPITNATIIKIQGLFNGGKVSSFASGGKIFGEGGPTDDKIPAYLSNGEYVVNAGAVSKYGTGFMDALNAGKFAKGGIAGYAEGTGEGRIGGAFRGMTNAVKEFTSGLTNAIRINKEAAQIQYSNNREARRARGGNITSSSYGSYDFDKEVKRLEKENRRRASSYVESKPSIYPSLLGPMPSKPGPIVRTGLEELGPNRWAMANAEKIRQRREQLQADATYKDNIKATQNREKAERMEKIKGKFKFSMGSMMGGMALGMAAPMLGKVGGEGSAVGGALSGAATGASMGSMFGVGGMAAGAVLGGAISLFTRHTHDAAEKIKNDAAVLKEAFTMSSESAAMLGIKLRDFNTTAKSAQPYVNAYTTEVNQYKQVIAQQAESSDSMKRNMTELTKAYKEGSSSFGGMVSNFYEKMIMVGKPAAEAAKIAQAYAESTGWTGNISTLLRPASTPESILQQTVAGGDRKNVGRQLSNLLLNPNLSQKQLENIISTSGLSSGMGFQSSLFGGLKEGGLSDIAQKTMSLAGTSIINKSNVSRLPAAISMINSGIMNIDQYVKYMTGTADEVNKFNKAWSSRQKAVTTLQNAIQKIISGLSGTDTIKSKQNLIKQYQDEIKANDKKIQQEEKILQKRDQEYNAISKSIEQQQTLSNLNADIVKARAGGNLIDIAMAQQAKITGAAQIAREQAKDAADAKNKARIEALNATNEKLNSKIETLQKSVDSNTGSNNKNSTAIDNLTTFMSISPGLTSEDLESWFNTEYKGTNLQFSALNTKGKQSTVSSYLQSRFNIPESQAKSLAPQASNLLLGQDSNLPTAPKAEINSPKFMHNGFEYQFRNGKLFFNNYRNNPKNPWTEVETPKNPKWWGEDIKYKNLYGKAYGGYISGPGGPKDDMIPAMLSDGEYVVKASSVAKYGSQFLNAVNEGRYAGGGIVFAQSGWDGTMSSSLPSYAVPKFSSPSVGNTSSFGVNDNSTYHITVNVAGSSSSGDDIAKAIAREMDARSRKANGLSTSRTVGRGR